MTPNEFSTAKFFLEDNARLIAAGKIQRWEVVKWAVAFNLALGAAASALDHWSSGFLVVLATLISVTAGLLLAFFNRKLTRCRHTMSDVFTYLKEQDVDLNAIVKRPMPGQKGPWYDDQELGLYAAVILLSWGAVLVIAALSFK